MNGYNRIENFDKYRDLDSETIKQSTDILNQYGDADATLNYLHFLRDDINKLIRQAKKAQIAKKLARQERVKR